MREKLRLEVPENDLNALTTASRARTASVRCAMRAKIILRRHEGLSKSETARALGVSEVTVQKWTDRYRAAGIRGLSDRPGRGRRPQLPDSVRERIVTGATQPPKGCTRHSTRTMATAAGVSHSTVRKIWNQSGIKPHLIRQFKVSKDPEFAAKFWDVIGLYLNPPKKAVVFCCDEKTQCQALERTQPGLPLGVGHIRTKTHDYTRRGTTTLFAALDYLTGRIVHDHHQVHTHAEWLSFLKKVVREAPKGVAVEIIADNYATHKHPDVRKWLEKHPRVHVHYTPTSSSWLNLVERFFGEITRDCIRDGSFSSVAELEKANDCYIAKRNARRKRIVWKAEGEAILRKINAARRTLGMSPVDEAKPGALSRAESRGS